MEFDSLVKNIRQHKHVYVYMFVFSRHKNLYSQELDGGIRFDNLIYELGSSEIRYNFNKSTVELHLILMTYMLATF